MKLFLVTTGAFVSALKKKDFELKKSKDFFLEILEKNLKLFCLFTNVKIIFKI